MKTINVKLTAGMLLSLTMLAPSASFSADLPSMVPTTIPTEWKAPYAAVYQELRANFKGPTKQNPHPHAQPAPKYPGVYLWDSSFISQVWKDVDTGNAEEVIRSVLNAQQPDGRVPQLVNQFGTSEWTNPPLLAWASSRIAARSKDTAFVREVYPKLRFFHEWLFAKRRLSTGLFFWLHPYESGLDNSPRFGARDESKFVDTRQIEAIDLSSFVVLDARALRTLAQGLLDAGASANEAAVLNRDIAVYDKQIDELSQLIRSRLWDEATGYFYDRDQNGNLVQIPTLASFLPLIAKVASTDQAARLMAHIRNPLEFNTEIPFPTVARNHPTFEKDCWRGPVWVNTAYLTMQGMKAYGYNAEEREMAFRLVNGVYKTWDNTKKFVEYYDPERFDFDKLTRKRGTGLFNFFSGSKDFFKFLTHLFAKQLYLGMKPVDHFVGWTGLVNTIVHDDLYPDYTPSEPPQR